MDIYITIDALKKIKCDILCIIIRGQLKNKIKKDKFKYNWVTLVGILVD